MQHHSPLLGIMQIHVHVEAAGPVAVKGYIMAKEGNAKFDREKMIDRAVRNIVCPIPDYWTKGRYPFPYLIVLQTFADQIRREFKRLTQEQNHGRPATA